MLSLLLNFKNNSCLAEFPTYEKALASLKSLKNQVGTNGLAAVAGSQRMRYYAAIKSGIMGKKYVCFYKLENFLFYIFFFQSCFKRCFKNHNY